MAYKVRDEMNRDSIELIRELLVYVARTYIDINPYLKGLHLTLDSFGPLRYE